MTRTTSTQGQGSRSSSASKNQTAKSASSNRENQSSHGKQGFASMPKEQVREIAREGGKHSHDNDSDRNKKIERRAS